MIENRAFSILFITKKKKKRLCMEIFWNPNTKCTESPQSSISTYPFSNVPSFLNIS